MTYDINNIIYISKITTKHVFLVTMLAQVVALPLLPTVLKQFSKVYTCRRNRLAYRCTFGGLEAATDDRDTPIEYSAAARCCTLSSTPHNRSEWRSCTWRPKPRWQQSVGKEKNVLEITMRFTTAERCHIDILWCRVGRNLGPHMTSYTYVSAYEYNNGHILFSGTRAHTHACTHTRTRPRTHPHTK